MVFEQTPHDAVPSLAKGGFVWGGEWGWSIFRERCLNFLISPGYPEVVAMDLTKELRLRRWARQNYVLPSQRSKSWHAIVLDEMRFKDAEMLEQVSAPDAGRYVPLMPTTTHAVDAAHQQPAEPKIVAQKQVARCSAPV
jgi:hypothetical protein